MAAKTCSGMFFTGILAVLLIACLAQCAAGSCLSYGHSCWGGHGKRSAATGRVKQGPAQVATDLENNIIPFQDRLFVSKLIRQNLRRNNIMPYPVPEDFLRSQRFMRNPFENRNDKGKFLEVNSSPTEAEDEMMPDQNKEADQLAFLEPYKVNFMEFMKNNEARQ